MPSTSDDRERALPVLLSAVFLSSLSALAFEVLLARMFSISQWHHLAFMVLSTALFGFAASGTVLATAAAKAGAGHGWHLSPETVRAACVLQSLSILAAFWGRQGIPLDSYRLLVEPRQAIFLMALYLLLTLPFFWAGAVAAAAYVLAPRRPGAVYFASMSGSAAGALAPAVLLPWCGEAPLVVCAAWVPLAALAARRATARPGAPDPSRIARDRSAWWNAAGALAAALAGAATLAAASRGSAVVAPSEYKALSQALRLPETRTVASTSSIRGRADLVEGPHLRFAPGLSLKFTGRLPRARAIFVDGDRPLYLYDLRSVQDIEFARFTLSFAGYRIVEKPGKVLVVTDGGGLAVACAIAAGAGRVRVLPTDPRRAEALIQAYGCEAAPGSPRSLLTDCAEAFDLVHVESWGAALPGADALHQNHLLTVDAFTQYLNCLKPGGALVVSGRLLLPPADPLRLWGTAFRALERIGAGDPRECIAVLRGFDTFTLIAARNPIAAPERLRDFARHLNFDLAYLTGTTAAEANRFNVFDEPYHYRQLERISEAFASGTESDFFGSYPLDVAPVSDLRPFPGRFLKWGRIGQLHDALGGRLRTLFLAGEVVVGVVLVETLLATCLLLGLPALVARRKAAASPTVSVCFAGIGAGFMFAELFFVHAGTFLAGDPVVSLALVVFATLAASGLGGLWAQRLDARALRPSLAAAAAGVVVSAVSLFLLSPWLMSQTEGWRLLALCLAAALPGFLLGLPFPLGMRWLLRGTFDKTFAWAVNGCASVLASVLSAQLAISAGFGAIVAAAALCYLAAAAACSSGPHGAPAVAGAVD